MNIASVNLLLGLAARFHSFLLRSVMMILARVLAVISLSETVYSSLLTRRIIGLNLLFERVLDVHRSGPCVLSREELGVLLWNTPDDDELKDLGLMISGCPVDVLVQLRSETSCYLVQRTTFEAMAQLHYNELMLSDHPNDMSYRLAADQAERELAHIRQHYTDFL
jgi:hypothetical protein